MKTKRVKIYSRYYSLCYGKEKNVPQIRISGIWLEKLGFFKSGTIEIQAENKKLIIKAL